VTVGNDSLVRVWTRGAAIRPVPSYAVVPEAALRRIEQELAEEATSGSASMDTAFERFEATQPELAARVLEGLEGPLDETALALGYFLSIAVWLAFESAFAARLGKVTHDAWRATVDALALEEDLRKTDAAEPFDLDDVLALEQPDILAFVHEHIEAALDTGGAYGDDSDDEELSDTGTVSRTRDVDVADVQSVYRTILLETLALSHAVLPDEHASEGASPELRA
jgi:hypothetical protein